MDFAVWRDISLLWSILLTLIPTLISAVILFFAIRGMHRLHQVVKKALPVVQDRARQVAEVTDRISRKVVNPLIGARAGAAGVGGITRAILARRKKA